MRARNAWLAELMTTSSGRAPERWLDAREGATQEVRTGKGPGVSHRSVLSPGDKGVEHFLVLRGTGNGCGRELKRLSPGQPGNPTPVRVRMSWPRLERAIGDSVPLGRR